MVLSVQLFTVRDPMASDPAGTLERLRGVGLEWVELAGTYGMEAPRFGELLDAAGLRVSGSHVGLDALEGDLGRVIADHRRLGCKRIILPWTSPETYAAGWEAFGRRLEPIADELADSGIEFAYHNHEFEFEGDGLGRLFESTSIRINAQLDLGWAQHAGEDPTAWVRRLGSKVKTVHLKDTKDGADCIAGEGSVDWDSALAACGDVGVEVGVIEMDVPPGDPVDCVAKCLAFFMGKATRS